MKTTTISIAALTIVLTSAAPACGASSPDRTADTASATTSTVEPIITTTAERPSLLVDETVRIDSGRLHLHCVGSGTSTVLLIAGWDAGGDETWGAVQPTIAEHARVCSYDRFGTGTSDRPATTQTFTTQAADLHALLEEAGEPGPYVVVGHSFGGAEGVAFASEFTDEVVGLMLLDASPTTWPAAVCAVPDDGTEAARELRAGCAVMQDPTQDPERLDVFAAFDEVERIRTLNDLPLTVMSAAHRTLPGLAASQVTRLEAVWTEGVDHWAGLSSSSTTVFVEDTGHHIQLALPELVIAEVMQLLP